MPALIESLFGYTDIPLRLDRIVIGTVKERCVFHIYPVTLKSQKNIVLQPEEEQWSDPVDLRVS